jgi:acetolactate synthase I/II/III large subunit
MISSREPEVNGEMSAADGELNGITCTGGEALVRWLEANEVEYIFGCSGHGNLGFLDALVDSKIQYISVPHEQIAVHAADAYYRASGKLGVVTTTIGPGVGNILNGILDALQDSSAVLVIAGDTIRAFEGTDSFQEIGPLRDAGQAEIFRPVVKRAFSVRQPEMLLNSAGRALNYATTGAPGPVLLSVAMDIFTYAAEFRLSPYLRRLATGTRHQADPGEVSKAANRILSAERPVVLAGAGVLRSGATAELVRFAEEYAVPVVTTMSAQSAFPNDSSYYAGNTGSVGTPTAAAMLQDADVLFVIGSRLGELDCSSWVPGKFIPQGCVVIQADVSPHEVGKTYSLDVGLVGDAKAILQQMLQCAMETKTPPTHDRRIAELAEVKREWWDTWRPLGESQAVPLEPAAVLCELQKALPEEAIILAGSGIRHHVGQFYSFVKPDTHMVASGNATMGWVTAAGIGARVASQAAPVVVLAGDGDFRSLSPSVGVAVEAGIPVIWIVLNNARFQAIARYQYRHYGRSIGTEFKDTRNNSYSPDYAALAEAYGAVGIRIETREELGAAVRRAIELEQPAVLDVPVNPDPKFHASGYWAAMKYFNKGWNLERSDRE